MPKCGLQGKNQTALTVKGFLNRIFAIEMTLQGRIFSYFHELFESIVSDAKRECGGIAAEPCRNFSGTLVELLGCLGAGVLGYWDIGILELDI